QYQPYLEYKPAELSKKQSPNTYWRFSDSDGSANDSEIPVFVDAFPSAMPILYLRARVGATSVNNQPGDNPVITNGTNAARPGQYDLSQIIAYTGSSIGVGKEKSVGTAHGLTSVTPGASLQLSKPNDAYPYFQNPSIANTAR